MVWCRMDVLGRSRERKRVWRAWGRGYGVAGMGGWEWGVGALRGNWKTFFSPKESQARGLVDGKC